MVEEWIVYLLISLARFSSRKRNMGKLAGYNERTSTFEIIDILSMRARVMVHVWDEVTRDRTESNAMVDVYPAP